MNYVSYNRDSFRYLCHYGTKGQKWGIRRFQNRDGSYTDEGRKRYSAKDYQKQLNKLDDQISKQRYKNARTKAQYNEFVLKTDKRFQKSKVSSNEAKKIQEKKNEYKKSIKDSSNLIKKGESIVNKTLTSAVSNGYTIDKISKTKFVRKGEVMKARLLAGDVAATVYMYTMIQNEKKKGYSDEATGYIQGNKFKVRKSKE